MVATSPTALPTDPNATTCGAGCVINATPTSLFYIPTSGVLAAGTTYYWQVKARGVDVGAWSSQRSFITAFPPARLTLGPLSLNFGSVQVESCSSASFSIQHVPGTAPASGTVSANPNPPFSISSGSSFSASGNEAPLATVQFCPTSAGNFSGLATVSSPGATFTSTNTVTLSGIGFNPVPITGAIQVNATLNGAPWSGAVNYTISGSVTLNGTNVPADFQQKPSGNYSLSYTSGGPSGAALSSITPSSSQTLNGGSTVVFTLNFVGTPQLGPKISSVSPNPVPGSTSQQPFTINGSNFVAGATVTLRDLDTAEPPFTNRLISFLSNTQIVINPNFTVAPHRWSIEIINPGGISSGQFPFQVVSPNLIIENVTFSPTSVMAGNNFTIGFDVRNVGTGNAPPTQARLRLSSDNILTLSDQPLSLLDVNIPAVAAGSSTHFSAPITIPNTTPSDSYFVGVFADWNNQGNQSDVTDDAGLSLPSNKLTVIGTGVPRPVITSQPQSQTVNAGGNVSFRVEVSETGPSSYQWFRDGNAISGATGPSLMLETVSTNQIGNYFATVSNSSGVAVTTPVTLTTLPGQPISVCQGKFKFDTSGFVGSSLPTVIITHGWQPSFHPLVDVYTGSPPEWVTNSNPNNPGMAEAIVTRLQKEGQAANILTYIWEEAYVDFSPISLQYATSCTATHGSRLGSLVHQLLGNNYSKPIQFIGHSLGSLVSAYAVQTFSTKSNRMPVVQLTILDAPLALFFDPFTSKRDFVKILSSTIKSELVWVDNYIAIQSLAPILPVIGGNIDGTAPNGGELMPCAHIDKDLGLSLSEEFITVTLIR